jgi:hypothetical protein
MKAKASEPLMRFGGVVLVIAGTALLLAGCSAPPPVFQSPPFNPNAGYITAGGVWVPSANSPATAYAPSYEPPRRSGRAAPVAPSVTYAPPPQPTARYESTVQPATRPPEVHSSWSLVPSARATAVEPRPRAPELPAAPSEPLTIERECGHWWRLSEIWCDQ